MLRDAVVGSTHPRFMPLAMLTMWFCFYSYGACLAALRSSAITRHFEKLLKVIPLK